MGIGLQLLCPSRDNTTSLNVIIFCAPYRTQILLSVSFFIHSAHTIEHICRQSDMMKYYKKEIEKLRVGSLPFLFAKCHVRAKRCQKKRQVVDKNRFFFLPFLVLRSSIRSKIDTRETQRGGSHFVVVWIFMHLRFPDEMSFF